MRILQYIGFVLVMLVFNGIPWLWAKVRGKKYEWTGGPQ